MNKAATRERVMSPIAHPDRAARTRQGARTWRTETSARRVALFASGLQRSDAPGAAMVAEAIKATVRQFGIHGCVRRMAQEFGDHPEAAAERMRWICQLAGEVPAWTPRLAAADRTGSSAGYGIDAVGNHCGATAEPGGRLECHRTAQQQA